MPESARISLRDADFLARLEKAFAAHAGDDALIDAVELQRVLGLRSEYLAGRVLAGFDRDGNGRIDRDEFLRGVRTLVGSDHRAKLRFAFDLHDGDGDGYIGETDLLRMIFIGLAEDQVVTDADEPERLARALWLQADTNRDGRISFDEFEAAVRRRPTLLASMTRSEAVWIAPNEALLERLGRTPPARSARLRRFVENHARELMLAAAIVVANAAVFAHGLGHASPYVPDEDLGVRLVRALGQAIALDVGLLFVPVSRRLLTRLRATPLGRVLPLDAAIDYHRGLGHALFGLGLAHGVIACGVRLRGHAGLAHFLFASGRGLTGVLLTALFAVIWLCALPFIRRSQRFELFYFTHLGYLAFVLLLVAHAPSVLLWAGIPLAAFFAERFVRGRVRKQRLAIVAAEALRSGVTRIALERPRGFAAQAGDYAFLNLPFIAPHEWHPFTISSAPERDELVFHVRALGNFTRALRSWAEGHEGGPLGVAQVDGPYGSPSAGIFGARVAVLIGAGIGVTPFASVLESIMMRAESHGGSLPLEKVHFFWLNRDQYAFEWFAELLQRLEASDRRNLLDIHICMTGGRAGAAALGLELARRAHHAEGAADVVTGLATLTRMGHPDWDAVLAEIARTHGSERVDVFFCGPPGLAQKVAASCARQRMRFHEERF